MRKIIGFRTLCVSLGIWVGTLVVSAQGEFKALPWSQSTAYNSYLMRDVHRQFADPGSRPFSKRLLLLPGCRSIWRVAVNDINK